jgi:hypothetical protein
MKQYKELKKQYGDFLSLDELSRACKIAKRSARYLVENGIIPAIDTGKRTWRYKIAIDDVIRYLKNREKLGSMIPPGAVTSRYREVKPHRVSTRKSYAYLVTEGQESEVAEYFSHIYADYEDVLTTPNIVEMTGLNKSTVLKLLKGGKIKAIENHPKYLIPKQFLLEFVVSRHFIEARTDSEIFKKILGGFEIWKTAKSSQ